MNQDIFTMAGYGLQKECARECIINEGIRGANCQSDEVGEKIGCAELNQCNNWAINECYCRQDLQGPALNYISSCVDARCTVGDNKLDISTAVGFYAAYCSEKGFKAAAAGPATASAVETGGGVRETGAPTAASSREVASPEQTGSSEGDSDTSSPSSSKPSVTTIIGIAAGAIAGVVLLIFGVWMLYRRIKRRDEAKRLQQLAQQQQQPPPPTYQAPSFPMENFLSKPYFPTPPQSEISPDESASTVGYRPAPTLMSGRG